MPLFEEQNIGQRLAFIKLAKACKQPFIMIIEEDFRLARDAKIKEQLDIASKLLSEYRVDAVKMRNRHFPGDPHYSRQSWQKSGGHFGKGLQNSHLLEHVVWDSRAEIHVPQIKVCHGHPKTWCTSSQHAHYTNNPVMYRTSFVNHLFAQVPSSTDIHFENWLTKYWSEHNFTVAYSDGIFTHDRLDRALV